MDDEGRWICSRRNPMRKVHTRSLERWQFPKTLLSRFDCVLCFCAGSRIFLRFQKTIDTIVYRDHARDGKGAWIGGPRRWVLQQGGSLVLVLYTTVGTLSSMCIGFGMRLLMCVQDLRLQFSVAQNWSFSIEHAYVGFVQKWSYAEALRVSKREMSVATRGT